ncbi:MAG: hypothetical protein RLZZ276_2488, partial [Pseudomonadota bacterium]
TSLSALVLASNVEVLAYDNGAATDAAFAGTGNDLANIVTGGTAGDTLSGAGGNDTLLGGAGDDTLAGDAGDDRLDGGAGADWASYAGAAAAVRVDLAAGTASGGAGTDVLVDIANVLGSSFADQLAGDAQANTLSGGAGDDTLLGAGGDDILLGGDGEDIARLGGAITFLRGDGGALRASSASDGSDALSGVEFVQQMAGDAAVARYLVIEARQGLDAAIAAASSGDVLVEAGALAVSLAQADAVIARGATFLAADAVSLAVVQSELAALPARAASLRAIGIDVLVAQGGQGFTILEAEAQALRDAGLTLGDGINVAPLAADDVGVALRIGASWIATGSVIASSDFDSKDGTLTVTQLRAGAEGATGQAAGIVGGVTSGAYGDLVLGADGAYTYTVRADAGPVSGPDVFTYTVSDGIGGTDQATLSITVPTTVSTLPDDGELAGTAANDLFVGVAGDQTFTGGNGNDVFLHPEPADMFVGGAGDDVAVLRASLTGFPPGAASPFQRIAFLDSLFLDLVDPAQPVFGVSYGDGQSAIIQAETLAFASDAGAILFAYRLAGNASAGFSLQLSADADRVIGGGATADSFLGGLGSDTLVGGGGEDRIHGEAGDDVLVAGNGAAAAAFAQLFGDAGSDTLVALAGLVHATGGSGADRFVVGGDGDVTLRIADFEAGVDLLDLSRSIADGASGPTLVQTTEGAQLTLAGGPHAVSVLFEGLDVADIDPGSFVQDSASTLSFLDDLQRLTAVG